MTIFIRNTILTAAVLVLPGCLAINALLGAAGLFATGPIQYAGTVYSIGEYAYEYAVNDKSPDEVIEEKFAWLAEPAHDPRMEGHATALTKTAALENPPAMPDAISSRPAMAKVTRVTLQPEAPREKPQRMVASLKSKPMAVPTTVSEKPSRPRIVPKGKQPHRPTKPLMQASTERPSPQHTYVHRNANPLQDRLDRMEQGLAMAERLMDSSQVDGIRYSVSSPETGETGTAISGPWSIRHAIMESPPSVKTEDSREGVLVTAQLSS